jgi:hypothetical protein
MLGADMRPEVREGLLAARTLPVRQSLLGLGQDRAGGTAGSFHGITLALEVLGVLTLCLEALLGAGEIALQDANTGFLEPKLVSKGTVEFRSVVLRPTI